MITNTRGDSKLKVYLMFLGGAGGMVTGSSTLLSIHYGTKTYNALFDFGAPKGKEALEGDKPIWERAFDYNPHAIDFRKINAIFLTHTHEDHTGFVPLACMNGLNGPIYTIFETIAACEVIMSDAARNNLRRYGCNPNKIIREAQRKMDRYTRRDRNKQKKRKDISSSESARESIEDIKPDTVYMPDDLKAVRKLYCAVLPKEIHRINEVLSVRFMPNSHTFGACSIEVYIEYEGEKVGLVFSGDVGPTQSYLHKNFDEYEVNDSIDYIILEAIHGDREIGQTQEDAVELIKEIALREMKKGNTVVYVGHAYERNSIGIALGNDMLDKEEGIRIVIDSAQTIRCNSLFYRGYEEDNKYWLRGFEKNPYALDRMEIITKEKQYKILMDKEPKFIITASAFGYFGRIEKYFEYHIEDPNYVFVFPSYLPPDSPSYELCATEEGEEICINGVWYVKKCKTYQIEGTSAHAFFWGKLKCIQMYPNAQVLINHGEKEEQEKLARSIEEGFNRDVYVPQLGEAFCISERMRELRLEEVNMLSKIVL